MKYKITSEPEAIVGAIESAAWTAIYFSADEDEVRPFGNIRRLAGASLTQQYVSSLI